MCTTYSSGWTDGREEARITKEDWEAIRAMLSSVPESVLASVERILDEHSAWISRPSREVTERIALAATIAAHVALTPEVSLN